MQRRAAAAPRNAEASENSGDEDITKSLGRVATEKTEPLSEAPGDAPGENAQGQRVAGRSFKIQSCFQCKVGEDVIPSAHLASYFPDSTGRAYTPLNADALGNHSIATAER